LRADWLLATLPSTRVRPLCTVMPGSSPVPGRLGTVTRAWSPTPTLPWTDAESRETSMPDACRTEIISLRGAASAIASTCLSSARFDGVVRTIS